MRKLEVIVLNSKDSIAAERAGADRLELVSSMEYGGLSPSLDIVKQVISSVSIPVNVMVRYRHQDFKYDQKEIDKLIEYIYKVKELGINGIVFGSLDHQDKICREQLKQVIAAARPLQITFHRAIDQSEEHYMANFKEIDGLVDNVLTSGGLLNPITNNIARLSNISNRRTTVLIGGGINQSNYQMLIESLPNCDFHIGSLGYVNGDFSQGIDSTYIAAIKQLLNKN